MYALVWMYAYVSLTGFGYKDLSFKIWIFIHKHYWYHLYAQPNLWTVIFWAFMPFIGRTALQRQEMGRQEMTGSSKQQGLQAVLTRFRKYFRCQWWVKAVVEGTLTRSSSNMRLCFWARLLTAFHTDYPRL